MMIRDSGFLFWPPYRTEVTS